MPRDRCRGPVAGLDDRRVRPRLTNTTLAVTLALERRYDRPPAARRADRRGPLLEGQDLRVDFVVLKTERPKEVVLVRGGLRSTVSLGIEARGRSGKEREREKGRDTRAYRPVSDFFKINNVTQVELELHDHVASCHLEVEEHVAVA